jgi:hypothetical protein
MSVMAPTSLRRVKIPALALSLGIACFAAPRTAKADVTSWLSTGGGYGFNHNEKSDVYARAVAASFAVGVGSDPTRSFVVGGVLRSTTYFSTGTDLGIAARFATGGFARGQWGLALDAGPMWRSFGHGEYGRWPVSAMLIGGAPWGVQLAVGGELFKIAGNDAQARGVTALLELDLLRLTVMRHGATDRYWENPSPAGGKRLHSKAPPLAGLLW